MLKDLNLKKNALENTPQKDIPSPSSIFRKIASQLKKPRKKNLYLIFLSLIFALLFVIYPYHAKRQETKKVSNSQLDKRSRSPTKALVTRVPTITQTPNLTPLPEKLVKTASGRIAFVMDGEVYVVNADRNDLQQITDDEYKKFGLQVSPDKMKIVYSFYPEDSEKQTNSGMYVGYNSGVAFVDVESKKVTVLIPYGNIQNHYANWTPDSRYITVWVGNGLGSKVIDTVLNSTILNLSSSDGKASISPVVWVKGKNKISYILNNSLYLANVDGSEAVKLKDGVDALRQVHEGPNVPEPPFWSGSGRFAAYYKDGFLNLYDSVNITEVVVGKATKEDMFESNYPQTYLTSYSSNEMKLFFLEYDQKPTAVSFDIVTGKRENIGSFGQSMVISPDKKTLFALTNEPYSNSPVGFHNLETGELKTCGSDFRHSYYWWAGGLGYNTSLSVWSPDNSVVVGSGTSGRDYGTVKVMLIDCTNYEIVRGNISERVWFP